MNHLKVPKSITKSSNRRSLRSVNLSSNQLSTIDAKFWLNTNLEKVDFSNNQGHTGATYEPDDYEISIYIASSSQSLHKLFIVTFSAHVMPPLVEIDKDPGRCGQVDQIKNVQRLPHRHHRLAESIVDVEISWSVEPVPL